MSAVIKRKVAVAFLVALGFENAASKDDDRIVALLGKVPEKVAEDKVPKGHEATYQQIVDAKGDVQLDKPEDEGPSEPKEKKPAKKDKASSSKPAAKSKDKEKPKKEKKERVAGEVDAFGFRKGSVRAKVNGALSEKWQSEADIVKASGVMDKQARSRLRRAKRAGFVEVQKIVQYRWTDKATKVLAGK